jgi:hypothetical protein
MSSKKASYVPLLFLNILVKEKKPKMALGVTNALLMVSK